MRALFASIIFCLFMNAASAQLTAAVSPQIGPSIVGGKPFVIAGGDWTLGVEEGSFRMGLGMMINVTTPKVKILGTGPYRHSLAYMGITAEYEFELADVTDLVPGDHTLRAHVLGGIGGSRFQYTGLTGAGPYSEASYYILQPSLFYRIGETDLPMMVGLSFRFIPATLSPPIAMRHLTGINITYRIMIEYDSTLGYYY